MNTQLSSATDYNVDNMIFTDPVSGSIPGGGGPTISFSRVNIQTRNPDGTVGDLILKTSRLFSFGVSENTNPDTGAVNGWTMPLCLWNRDGATPEEKAWSDTFDKIVEKCKDHVLDNKEELDKFDLERSDLKKLNPLYWKKEKKTVDGKTTLAVVEGTGPTLYAKLIYSKKTEKFVTKFFDQSDQPVDPLDMIGKYCYVEGAVKVESIFIGNKISLQVKLYEAVVEPMQSGMKRLLPRPKPNSMVLESNESAPFTAPKNDSSFSMMAEDDDSDGSLDDAEPVAPAPTKKVVKKVVRKVVRKGA